jgi:nitrous oxide reductase
MPVLILHTGGNSVNRRSFVLSLFGGLAAASLGGAAIAQAATELPVAAPAPEGIDATTKAGLDKAHAEFSQVVVRRTTVVRRPGYRPAYRRPVVVRRTTVVRRPAYRPAYRRPVVVRRRVIVR